MEMRVTFDKYDKLATLKELKASKHQRNKHPKEQIERLAKIMREHGVRHPIHVSKLSGNICFGHGRLEAAKLNKFTKYPIVYQEFKDDTEEYACVQSDNAVASWAELDLAGINTDIVNLGLDFDIDLLGIKDFTIEPADKFQPQCDEDEVPEKVEPNAKLGDIYQLGNHRLMCGDSTSVDAVDKLMNGDRATITFTSPPYNAERRPTQSERNRPNHQAKKYESHNDGLDQSQYKDLITLALSIAKSVSGYQLINIQHLAGNKIAVIDWLYAFKDHFVDTLIWFKEHGMPQMAEKCLNSSFEYIYIFSEERMPSKAIKTASFRNIDNVYVGKKQTANEYAKVHAATFPVHLPEFIISQFTKPSDQPSVLDVFGGTGTTLIACEKTNRKCFMMEIDPHYVDVIIARWEKYTGKKAELLNGQAKEGDKRGPGKKPGGNKLLLRRNGSGAQVL